MVPHGIALLPETRCDDARETLRPLARRTARRVHWRDEEEDAKAVIIETIVGLNVESLVVVGAMIDDRKQERNHRCGRNGLYGRLSALVEHIDLGSVWARTCVRSGA